MLSVMQEKRPLKRPRLGPPDVYPQEAKQREDELNSMNVKHGFTTAPQIQEEFGTARNCNVTASKVGAYFNAILQKKEELMTLPDSGRKKQQMNPKDNFWPVTARTKATLDTWFKDLAGTKPLMSLAKKAPSFNKKEEIFVMLCENQVSMQRAAWFIKLSSAYTVAVSEAKIKKRQMPDPATEWTGTLIKFLKDLIPRLQDHYQQTLPEKSSNNMVGIGIPTFSTIPQPLASPATSMHSPANLISISGLGSGIVTQDDYKTGIKQWNYCMQLSKYMYEEGLLDRQEFLNWVLDLLDKLRSQPADDGILKLFLPLTLQYLQDFVQSERLSRRLSYLVAKKISFMINNASELAHHTTHAYHVDSNKNDNHKMEIMDTTPATPNNSNYHNGNHDLNGNSDNSNGPKSKMQNNVTSVNPLENVLNDYLNCPHHRDLILQLSVILQVVTLENPTAVVWCGIGENRASPMLIGSPLDHLPVSPSALPMPTKCIASNNEIRRKLRVAEESIKTRSRHAEARWCTDKWRIKNSNACSRTLSTLDALDSHCFDRMDTNYSLETLYSKIFPPLNVTTKEHNTSNGENKETKIEYNPSQDAPIVQILCEWAVSWQRWGEHRAMAVAWLLDKRQNEVLSSDFLNYNNNSGNSDDKDSVCSGNGLNGGVPVFQNLLMNFLDNDAPVLEENGTPQNRAQFRNLVHLFSELIPHDVFSHDAYMCTLISRGDLLTGVGLLTNSTSMNTGGMISTGPVSNKPQSPMGNQGIDDDVFAALDFKPKIEEFDDSNVDDDLDKILQHIKEDQQNSMDAPDSPKDNDHHAQISNVGNIMSNDPPAVSRHFLYTKHFPLCPDDPFSQHDCNQRYVLLFGVGKERDEKKHAVKKMSKEICKLFSKKFSIDVAEGGKVKKHSRNEFNFEATTNKCQSMSYFDQHFVTWQCAVTVQEMLNSFALGNSNYLPVQEHVAFLFDLMETALNIYGLIDMCIQILKELPDVEGQLLAKNSNLIRNYTTSLSLYVVGVLRRYHCSLLLSTEQTSAVFEGLCKVVKHVTNPGDCSSSERCILAYLFDLYSSCSLLKTKPQPTEPFHNAYPKIRQALYAPIHPIASSHPYNPLFLNEVFINPRRGGKIETIWGRLLNEAASNRYSFVCNAIISISREIDNDRLNDIAATCAELTACCNSLSAEWLGALVALCGSCGSETYYPDILSQVDVQNLNIHNSLAVFTCILVARHCFSLENFVVHVALPALVNACNGGREITQETEAGARLACHLLLRLYKTIEIPQPSLYSVSTSPNPITTPGPACNIKLSCDRHLLAAAHKNIAVAPVLAVLKGILVVSDATAHKSSTILTGGKRSGLNTPVHPGSTPKSMAGPVDLSHILGTSDLAILGGGDDPMLDISIIDLEGVSSRPVYNRQQHHSIHSENATSLSEFAQHVLRQICSQEWVLERCLQNAEELCQPGMLIDPMLTAKQAQRLLHMICYPENESNLKSEMDQKSIIVRILENLEQWSLRISWLDLQLMFKQTNCSSPDLSNWLDIVARAAIGVFQVQETNNKQEKTKPSTWLVAPLVSKLPSAVQGRILRVAGQVLESALYFNPKTKDIFNGNNINGNSLIHGNDTRKKTHLSHQPFLGLVLTCLKGQDEQKEGLLASLHTQLSQFLQSSKEMEKIGGMPDPQEILDALQLRFSLVGGMFDAIQKNATSTTDWAILLAQLISQGVIDLNSELFTTILDMLATLIHSTLICDIQSERDENKKLYTNLMKKLRKELGEKNNASIKFVRQLLPLAKQTCEVIACEQAGSDTKANKGLDSTDKKHSLQVHDKQRVTVWDLLEGHKNPAPLSWAWFGAVKMERKPLAYEETHRLLKYHTHSLIKPSSYFYEPLPLPPEDLEPIPEKPKEDLKADTPSSVDQSPGGATVGTGRGRGKGGRRPRKPKQGPAVAQATPPPQQPVQQQIQPNPMSQMQMNMQNQINPNMQQYQQNQMVQNPNQMMQQQAQVGQQSGMSAQMIQQNQQVGGMNFGPGGSQIGQPGPQPQQQQQQWGGYNQIPQQQQVQQQQQQQQQQTQFYNQGMPQQINRFERPPINPSKQALSNMLRQRHPFMNASQTNSNQFAMQRQQQQVQQQQQQQVQQQQVQQQQQQQQLQQQYQRNTLRTGMGGPVQMPSQAGLTGAMGQGMGIMNQQQNINQQAINPNAAMIAQQAGQMNQNQPQQNMMNQGTGMMSNNNSGIMGQSGGGMVQTPMGQAPGMMPQQTNAPMVNQGMTNAAANVGMQNMQQNTAQQNMFPGQQYQGMGQTFSSYNNQGMGQQANQQNMMGNFNQMGPQRNTQAEYLAQQQRTMQTNRGQYMQQAPNVTMNNMVGQGAAPPYPRQGQQGGKPGIEGNPPAVSPQQQQFQQQLSQQRIRQQLLIQQRMGQSNVQGMTQGQGMNQQQTPALVAQLQRQLPAQQNMMGQQYPHQPPPY